jgi:thiol-disulfide isomerase/thioredoxin
MGWKEQSRKNSQLVLFWIVIIFSAILLSGYFIFSGKEDVAKQSSLSAPSEREQARKWEVSSLDEGDSIISSSLRGKIVILHFWASWCPPCGREFPEFAKWAEKNVDNADLVIVPVSIDKNKEDGKAFFDKYSGELKGYYDQGKTAGKFSVQGIPATVIIDRKGKIAFEKEGVINWRGEVMNRIVSELSREGS